MEKIEQIFWDDDNRIRNHMGELQEKYREKWVAVVNKKVAAVAEGPETARKIAREKTGEKQIPVIFVESGENLY